MDPNAAMLPVPRQLTHDSGEPISSTVVNLKAGTDRRPLVKWQRGLALLTAAKPTLHSQHLVFSTQIILKDDSLIAQSMDWLRALIRRHPLLRTRLSIGELTLENILSSHIEPDIRCRDCSQLDEEAVRSLAREECREVFDFTQGPLWRIHLYKRTPTTTLVCLVLHHAVFDFWSLGLLLSEVLAFLGVPQRDRIDVDGEGFLSSVSSSPTLDFPGDPSALQGFWTHYLQGVPLLHQVATDLPRRVTSTEPGGSVPLVLDKHLAAVVPALCKQAGVTPFMLFLTLWYMFLSRLAI